MRIKNKKRLNTIIAVFVAVFAAGGAFAFVSAGPLLFSGTAAVDAELAVHIVHSETRPFVDTHNLFANYTTPTDYYINEPTNNRHNITFGVTFTQPYQVIHFVHKIKNEGTMDAKIVDVKFDMKSINGEPAESYPEYDALREAIEHSVMANFGTYPGAWVNPILLGGDNILAPGQDQDIWFRMFLNPIPESFGISKIDAAVEFELEIVYTLAS
jgi:hypothetical protein